MEVKKAFYGGSFDPFTIGHLYVVSEALSSGYDQVIIGIGKNPKKTTMFSIKERVEMIKKSFEDLLSMVEFFRGEPLVFTKTMILAAEVMKKNPESIKIVEYDGMTIDAAIKNDADVLLRGVRSGVEREEERRLSSVNNSLCKIRGFVCPTLLIDASTTDVSHISSTALKNLMSAGEYILAKSYVTPSVHDILARKYLRNVYNQIAGDTGGFDYLCKKSEEEGFQRFSASACELNMLNICRLYNSKIKMDDPIYDLAIFWSTLVKKNNVDEGARGFLKDIVKDFSSFVELCEATNGGSSDIKNADMLYDICMNQFIYRFNCLPNLWQRWQVCKTKGISVTEFFWVTKFYDEKFVASKSFFKTEYFIEKYDKSVMANIKAELKVLEVLMKK